MGLLKCEDKQRYTFLQRLMKRWRLSQIWDKLCCVICVSGCSIWKLEIVAGCALKGRDMQVGEKLSGESLLPFGLVYIFTFLIVTVWLCLLKLTVCVSGALDTSEPQNKYSLWKNLAKSVFFSGMVGEHPKDRWGWSSRLSKFTQTSSKLQHLVCILCCCGRKFT